MCSRLLRLAIGFLVVGGACEGVEGQASRIAAGAVRVGGSVEARTVPYLQARMAHRASVLGMSLQVSVSARLDLDDAGASLLNLEDVTVVEQWSSAELRIGIGDVPWGLSALRSPIDALRREQLSGTPHVGGDWASHS